MFGLNWRRNSQISSMKVISLFFLSLVSTSTVAFLFHEVLSPNWESLVFILPTDKRIRGLSCKQHSRFYCLDKYSTRHETIGDDDDMETFMMSTATAEFSRAMFTDLIRHQWWRINMVDQFDPTKCCEEQTDVYMMYGFHRKLMSPEEYLGKLMDYENEDNKPINYVAAYYLPNICQNVVFELGFGPGPLELHPYTEVHAGAPFVIPGSEFPESIAIPIIESKSFDFYNPNRDMSFRWFKYNIMCSHHPWICYSGKKNGLLSAFDDFGLNDENDPNKRKRTHQSQNEGHSRKRHSAGESSTQRSNVELRRRRQLYSLTSRYTKRKRMQRINKCRST